MRSLGFLFLTCLIGITAGCSRDADTQQEGKPRISQDDSVAAALRESRVDDALRIAQNALVAAPDNPDALTGLARVMAAKDDRREASLLLAQAARAADFHPESRVELSLHAFLDLGLVYPAIDLLIDTLNEHPGRHKLRRTLYGLLGEAGRIDLMQEHYEAIIRNRKFDVPVLIAFTDTSRRLFVSDSIDAMIERNPDDHRIKLGIAQSLRDNQRFEECETVLRKILEHHKDFGPAHALLGRMPTTQQSSESEFAEWYASASPHCGDQVDFWIALGDRHFQSHRYKEALPCYASAARISPNMPTPWIQLGRLLRLETSLWTKNETIDELAVQQLTESCSVWAKGLFRVRQNLELFGGRNEKSQRAACSVARELNSVGRYWEAEAWAAVASTLPAEIDPSSRTLRSDIIANLQRNQQWSSPPDISILEKLASENPELSPAPRRSATNARIVSSSQVQLHLSDETTRRGLAIPPTNYPDIASSLIYSLGAGGGSFDFDSDGNPDLVFRSGGKLDDLAPDFNSLFRNLDGQFVEIASHTGCQHTGHGQGIAIGDFNEDGFQDVFFANIGPNRLFRNNGDGTFSDATVSLGRETNQWTTCGAFADLNRDGIADLLAANYCDLDSDVTQPCRNGTKEVPCHPARFPADQDQVLIATAAGGFQASFKENIRQIASGRGLGIVAGALVPGGVSALVANDMSTNHFLRVTPSGLAETAVPFGLAVDGQSRTQASMGIAYGDFDGDQDLDFYVTGFAREYNIYYEQLSPGLWVDSTHRQKLVEPTRLNVGFGTQAVDLDADGINELAVTNGHIGDFGPDQPSLAQSFQLMRRSRNGNGFTQQDLCNSDPYFCKKQIGRALFKLDVDQDLAEDLVVTHQNSPPVLLINQTETNNRRIGFRLIGTTSSRDAVGSVVSFATEGRTHTLWSMSGDGYMCSNERILRAGIGTSQLAENVTVTWPSGNVESFDPLNAGHIHVLIEGSGESFQSR